VALNGGAGDPDPCGHGAPGDAGGQELPDLLPAMLRFVADRPSGLPQWPWRLPGVRAGR